ncbi:MAG: hypothetical protein QM648_01115 [Solirubrobacterales bacterium]
MIRTIRKTSAAEFALLALTAVMAVAFLTGCGKPQYCSDLTTLQTSVKDLPSQATNKGVSGLKSQITTIENNAKALVSSAKSDFPTESSAVESSVNQLTSSVSAVASTPTASQVTAVALNASAVVKSVQSFASATESECK